MAKVESQIISQAGLPAMVTIATKMAGRGTDIVLGGNPRGLAEQAIHKLVFSDMLKSGIHQPAILSRGITKCNHALVIGSKSAGRKD